MKKNKKCPICDQKMDIVVTSHKSKPFIDNKLYSEMCFTCYHVPKISDQKYDKNGYITEEVDLEYSNLNLNTAKDLLNCGSADSLQCAKKCVEAVKNLKILKQIKDKKRPKLEFYAVN